MFIISRKYFYKRCTPWWDL